MIKKIFLIVALCAALFALVGCQTVQGLGRDITWTGEAVGGLFEGN